MALTLLVASQPHADGMATRYSEVTWVADGDTFQVVLEGERQLIRLAGIDAPERDQRWGHRARQALMALTLHERVRIVVTEHDDYGRLVARVYVDGRSVNRALVASGNAWVYDRYADDPVLDALERRARRTDAGLWRLPGEPVPPWRFRHSAE